MLSDEEKKAIKTIKDFKDLKWYEHAFDNGTEILDEEEKQDIKIVLNLIEKHSKEIEELNKLNRKLEQIIDKMAEKLTTPIHSKEWVIAYFKGLVD